jgi:hypothetical protein
LPGQAVEEAVEGAEEGVEEMVGQQVEGVEGVETVKQ